MDSLSRDTLCPLPSSVASRPSREWGRNRRVRLKNGGVVCGNVNGMGHAEPAFGFSFSNYCLMSDAVKVFWQQERKRGAVALAVVTVGVSLSFVHPAVAETMAQVHSTQSQYVMDDVTANLSPSEISELGAELQKIRLAQSSTLVIDDGDTILREQTEETARKAGQDASGYNNLRSMEGSGEVVGERRASAVLLPAGCPPSNLVAAAAVGSVASAVSKNSQHVGLFTRLLQHLGGGGFAGAVGATVVYPLDTVKTRLQAQSEKDGKYKDVLDCFRQLLLEEGLGSLYNGLVPQLLGIAPEKALKLTVNEVMLGVLEQHLPGARVWALEFIAGGGGGFSQVLVTNPMEVVKLRLQIQSKVVSPKGLWEMVQELGLRGLYNGSGITLARDVPSSAIFFACYALITQMYPDQRFWAGFLAAIPATIFVTPLDVIKTRLQMETPLGEEPYKNACHCFRVLLQQEGLRGLFKGGLLRVLRTSPQFGITLLVYSFFCDGC